MRYLYLKPKLKDLTQGSRIAFARQFRRFTQDEVAEKLGMGGEIKEEEWQDTKVKKEFQKM